MNAIQEILPGLFHWVTFHEGIGQEVHSYYISAGEPSVLIDPRVPEEGLEWFEEHPLPTQIYLTNRLHYRHSDRFSKAFKATVWCHRAGLHHFTKKRPVKGFKHGDLLPGGITALEVGVLCPEETALFWPKHEGVLSIGDAIIRESTELGFVPDELMGDDPESVKRGLCTIFRHHLSRKFDSLLFAHGEPLIGGAKAVLARFIGPAGGRGGKG